MEFTYQINEPDEVDKLPSITCLLCGTISIHPKDVRDLWCNTCDFTHKREGVDQQTWLELIERTKNESSRH
jgi:hypothetical protein